MARVYRSCTARDGRAYVVRAAELTDAPLLIAHTRAILEEPEWNVTEQAEFGPSRDQEESWILSFGERSHSVLLVADFGLANRAEIAGLVSLSTQPRFRLRHRGRIGISVQAPYRRLGVGETLLRTALDWATSDPELERIELSVFSHNGRALGLYRKLGFVEEARFPRSIKLRDGTYYDELTMARWVK